MGSLITRIIPFIFLGVMIVLLVAGIIVFSYLLMVGALIGLVLFAFSWIKNRLFRDKSNLPANPKTKTGRTIDHDDL